MTTHAEGDTEWDDAAYLAANADVAVAVAQGQFADGRQHYRLFGKAEGRPPAFGKPSQATKPTWTRLCADPWNYAEISADMQVKPCCNYHGLEALSGPGASEAGFRNSQAMRELRLQLISGDLSPVCARCHIREKVPLASFDAWLKQKVGAQGDRLAPAALRDLRVDVTSACNLRCVYCAVSQPGYAGVEMPAAALDAVVALASASDGLDKVSVNGHGETTTHPAWRPFCESLLERGLRLSIITNLAKNFSDEEMNCLARFREIQLSIDSADPEEARNVRRKVRLEHILFNITRIKMAASRLNVRTPYLMFSCGIYDRNAAGLPDFARMAAASKIDEVTFWNLVKYPDIPGAANVQPIDTSNQPALRAVVAHIEEASAILASANIRHEFAGGFFNDWKARAG